MKHKLSTFFAILMMALAIPQSVKAYDFSKTYQGKTLYYNIIGNEAEVTYPSYYHNRAAYTSYWYNYTMPTGTLTIPDSVSFNGVKYCVTSIGDHAFWRCHNLTTPNTYW